MRQNIADGNRSPSRRPRIEKVDMQDKPLTGKVAIVTGAGSPIGMGRAMTIALVQAGARVAMLDINEKWLEQSANEVRAVGGDDCVLALVCDVSDPESVEGRGPQDNSRAWRTTRPDQQRGDSQPCGPRRRQSAQVLGHHSRDVEQDSRRQ